MIPARGGSKGIPNKNITRVGGVTLVGRSVFAAHEFVRMAALTEPAVIVDTDSESIAAEARAWGATVPFLRAPGLAADDTSTVESTLGLLERLESAGDRYDVVVLLQPTSPLRTAEDVLTCWKLFCTRDGAAPVASVTAEEHPSGLAVRREDSGVISWLHDARTQVVRRQDLRAGLRLTGSVYITRAESLRADRAFVIPGRTVGVELPPDRSVDVDTLGDIAAAEGLLRSRPGTRVTFANAAIGPGEKCFVIAEAGVNHNGDPQLAHRLVDAALASGADAVKFQVFDPAALASDTAPKAEYQIVTTGKEQSQRDMLSALTLPHPVLRELAEHARARGILFLATPFDNASADFLEEIGCPALKIPSGEVTNHGFLASLARRGLPLLLSTGMSTMAEVASAVAVIRANGDPALALFHCVTNYPAHPADCNLGAMHSMRSLFSVPVGWSDHTTGLAVTVAAAALGAETIEKHFTLDRTMAGPDHAASLEPDELAAMVRAVREAEACIGSGVKAPAQSEMRNLEVVRRSLHAARDLVKGAAIGADDLIALRPGGGIPPFQERAILGRRLRRAIAAGQRLEQSDVE